MKVSTNRGGKTVMESCLTPMEPLAMKENSKTDYRTELGLLIDRIYLLRPNSLKEFQNKVIWSLSNRLTLTSKPHKSKRLDYFLKSLS